MRGTRDPEVSWQCQVKARLYARAFCSVSLAERERERAERRLPEPFTVLPIGTGVVLTAVTLCGCFCGAAAVVLRLDSRFAVSGCSSSESDGFLTCVCSCE